MPPECRQCGIRHSELVTCNGAEALRPLGDAYFGTSSLITRHAERLQQANAELSRYMDAIEIGSAEEANRVFGVPTRPPYPLDDGVHVVVHESNNPPTTIQRGEMDIIVSIYPENSNGDYAAAVVNQDGLITQLRVEEESLRLTADIYALICNEISNRCGVPKEFLASANSAEGIRQAIKKFRQQQEDQMLPTDVFKWL